MKKSLVFFLIIILLYLLCGCATKSGKNNGNPLSHDQTDNKEAVKATQTGRGEVISFDERIFFDTGKHIIKKDGQASIDRLAALIHEKIRADILVEGHTDNVGGAKYNMNLSQKRANAVKQALIARGVSAKRIKTMGFGMAKPVENNSIPKGRQANRRTEIIVVSEKAASFKN